MVTHLTTSQPIHGLHTAERTGCPVLHDLWPHVTMVEVKTIYDGESAEGSWLKRDGNMLAFRCLAAFPKWVPPPFFFLFRSVAFMKNVGSVREGL